MNTVNDVIELTFPARAEYVGVARLTVSGIAHRTGLSYDEIEDIKLAVAEACTNAVQHAYADDVVGTVFLRCKIKADRLIIEVADDGNSFELATLPDKLQPIDTSLQIDELIEGGLGLYLIHTLMDEVQISAENGFIISMTKYLRDEVADNGVAIAEPTN